MLGGIVVLIVKLCVRKISFCWASFVPCSLKDFVI